MNILKKLGIALIVAIAVSLVFLFRDELKPGPTLEDFSGATELHPVVEEKKINLFNKQVTKESQLSLRKVSVQKKNKISFMQKAGRKKAILLPTQRAASLIITMD